jgi:hypothetical protein
VVDGGDAEGGGVDGEAGGGEGFDGGEGGDGEVGLGGGAGAGVGIDDGGEFDGEAGVFELAVDAEVVAAEDACADDGDAEWDGLALGCLQNPALLHRSLNRLTAAGVERKQLGDLVVGLGGGCDAKAGGAGGLGADVGLRGDELEQIERDVLGAASRVVAFTHEKPLLFQETMVEHLRGWWEVGRGGESGHYH